MVSEEGAGGDECGFGVVRAGASRVADGKIQRRAALAHDWLVGYRGGEMVLELIARVIERDGGRGAVGGVYTMFADEAVLRRWARDAEAAAAGIARDGARAGDSGGDGPTMLARVWAEGGERGGGGAGLGVVASSLSRFPKGLRRWLLPAYPLAVAELSWRLARAHARRPVDLVVSTSSAAIKGLRAPRGVPHVCYCHTPARYLWTRAEDYGHGRGGRLRRMGLSAMGGWLRAWDRRTAANVTRFIANSTHTARLIEQCYGREARVIHPPVRTRFFTPPPPPLAGSAGERSGWLCVGALEPYKRVDMAIRAAAEADEKLTVIGDGSQRGALTALARSIDPGGERIVMAGRQSDDALREAYRRARVLLFPQVEDFGITAVEAQACGTPVAALKAGGALDSVVDGETGVLFETLTAAGLAEAARACERLGSRAGGAGTAGGGGSDVSAACRRNAERFGVERFEREIALTINLSDV